MAARRLYNAQDFQQLEIRNAVVHVLGTAPSSPVPGQIYYDSGAGAIKSWNGSAWTSSTVAAATSSTLGTIQLAGDLSGTATSPTIATGAIGTGKLADASVTGTKIASATITDANIASANKDGTSATPSLRTLGTGSAQASPGNRTLDQVPTAVANIGVGGFLIQNLGTPASSTDAATKGYVDGTAQGLTVKPSVKGATTSTLPAYTGTATTLTANANGAFPTTDGVSYVASDLILVKDETSQQYNGIYQLTTAGGVSTAWVLTRISQMNTATNVLGAYTFVEAGTVNVGSGWVVTTPVADAAFTLGTNNIVWTQFSGAGEITAGNGLTKSGNTLSVNNGAGLSFSGGVLLIGSGAITNAMLAGSIDLTTKVTGSLPVANGGTGTNASGTTAAHNIGAAAVFSGTITGDGSTTAFTVTHNLNTRQPIVQIYDQATSNPNNGVEVNITSTGTNTISVSFDTAPANATVFYVTVVG